LHFEKGKNYCILGKNGSGKSSLALSIMGHPLYQIAQGEIGLDNEPIHNLPADERSQKGVFLAFQAIPEIKGVKLFEFLRSVTSAHAGKQYSFIQFKALVLPLMDELGIPHDFLRREVNVGFSGGEKRKIEVLQLRLLNPSYIFLDEVDSGLDVDGFKQVA
jgi:Fe-S cluster assembly ATP-binding protein